jgi:hypothetical protein
VVNVTGRLLTAAGDPLPGVSIEAWPLPSGDFAKQLPGIVTGVDGRFAYTLLPGCSYHLRAEGSGLEFAAVADDLAVEPGQTIDLGDLRIGPDGKVMAKPVGPDAASISSNF